MVCKFFPYKDSEVEDMQMAWRTKCEGSSIRTHSSVSMVFRMNKRGMDCIAGYQTWVLDNLLIRDDR